MTYKLLLIVALCAVFCCVNSQQFTSAFTIDDFSVSSKQMVVYPSLYNEPVFTNTSSLSILGTVRVIEVKVVGGRTDKYTSVGAEVAAGLFNVYAGVEPIEGYSVLIYDGSASGQINPSGLFGSNYSDFTLFNANALHLTISSSIISGNTNLITTVYSGSMDDTCEYEITIVGNGNEIDYFLSYDSFTLQGQGCDFSNVGAITFQINVTSSQSVYINEIEAVYLTPSTNVFVIDSFQSAPNSVLITVPLGGVPVGGLEDSSYGLGPKSDPIIGNERDMQLYIYEALEKEIIYAQVQNGYFTTSSPGLANGKILLQYDGTDLSPTLQPNGLAGLNFTSNNGYAFQFGVNSTAQVLLSLYVYSGSISDYCITTIVIPENQYHDYTVYFSEFQKAGAGCDFSSVGAVELQMSIINTMTSILYYFNVLN